MHNTIVTYLYRDAGNYKFWGEVILEGALSLSEVEPYCIAEMAHVKDHFFLPDLVKLPCLIPRHAITTDDLDWHSVEEMQPTTEKQTLMTARNFLDLFKQASQQKWPIPLMEENMVSMPL